MYIHSRQIAQQRTPREYGLAQGATRTTICRQYQPYDGHVCVAHYPAGHPAERLIRSLNV
jgi:hypothetical protein